LVGSVFADDDLMQLFNMLLVERRRCPVGKRALMVVGEVYTVTAEDLSWGENLNR